MVTLDKQNTSRKTIAVVIAMTLIVTMFPLLPKTSFATEAVALNTVSSPAAIPLPTSQITPDLTLAASAPEFSTRDSTPTLTWNLETALSTGKQIYIVDKTTGSVIRKSKSKSGSVTIPRFYTEPSKDYIAVIGDVEDPSNPVTIEMNILNPTITSEKITVKRSVWNTSLTLTNNDKLTVTAVTNQDISKTNGKYLVYLVHIESNTIVASWNNYRSGNVTSGFSYSKTFNNGIGDIGTTRSYKAIVAAVGANEPEQLTDIQSVSNTVTDAKAGWEVSIGIDKPQFTTEDSAPRITALVNQPIPSSHRLYMADLTTGRIFPRDYGPSLRDDGLYQHESLTNKFYSGPAHTYQAFIAADNGATSVAKLRDIRAQSNTVSAERAEWSISLNIDKTVFSTDDDAPLLTAVSNQNTSNTSAHYSVYIVDMTTNEFANITSEVYMTEEVSPNEFHYELPIQRFKIGPGRIYKAYVAASGAEAPSEMRDIQTESNTVFTERQKWNLSLEAKIIEPRWNGYMVEFTARTNQRTYGFPQEILIFSPNGKNIERIVTHYPDDAHVTVTEPIYIPTEDMGDFVGYVAAGSSDYYETVEGLLNVETSSVSVWTGLEPGSINTGLSLLQTLGGKNPSMAECAPQCYGDPVNSANGELFYNVSDISLNSSIPFEFVRSYSSLQSTEKGALGYGWTHNYNMSLEGETNKGLIDSDKLTILQENGSHVYFYKIGQGSDGIPRYVTTSLTLGALAFDPSTQKYTFSRHNGFSFEFDTTGRMISIFDRNDNRLTLTYDASNRLKTIEDNVGRELELSYTNDSNISKVTDSYGRSISYAYDANSNLTEASHLTAGNGYRYTYAANHKNISMMTPLGGTFTNEYEASGKVKKQTDPHGKVLTFEYSTDASGNFVTKITNSLGHVQQDTYNKGYQLISSIEGLGSAVQRETRVEYDEFGRQTKIINPGNQSYSFTHDARGNRTSSKDALGRISTATYNEFNLPSQSVDAAGNTTYYSYDERGNTTSVTDALGNITSYTYNPNGTVATIQSPKSRTENSPALRQFAYDENGYLIKSTDEDGVVTDFDVNQIGMPKRLIDAKGNGVTYFYNTKHQPIQTTYANGAYESQTFDPQTGLVTESRDTDGNVTSFTYNSLGLVTSETSILGTTTYTYDAIYRLTSVKDYAGRIVKYEYDDVGNVISVTNHKGHKTSYTYDSAGNQIATKNALNDTTSYEYDATGQLLAILDPTGARTEYTYTALGMPATVKDANGKTIKWEYDRLGRPVVEHYPDNTSLRQSYDANGNVISKTDQNGNVTSYEYGLSDKLLKVVNPEGKQKAYAYDIDGTIAAITYADGTVESHQYNQVGNLSAINIDNPENDAVAINTAFTYDMAGRLTSADKNGTVTSYAYDQIGNLTYRGPPQTSDASSGGISYAYNDANNLSTITYADGTEVAYDYDVLGNIVSTSVDNEEIASHAYNATSTLASTHLANGLIENYEYSSRGEETKHTIQNDSSIEIYEQVNTYDSLGLLTNTSLNAPQVDKEDAFAYDLRDRISSHTSQTGSQEATQYAFDGVGNLTSHNDKSFTYNKVGQLLQTSTPDLTNKFTYDARGNRVQEEILKSDVLQSSISLSWGLDNSLTSIKVGNVDYNYAYDHDGLLTSRSKHDSGVTAETDAYTWDVVSAVPLMLSDADYNYIYSVDNTPVAQIDKDTQEIQYLHNNKQSSISLVTDAQGEVLAEYDYDAYGNITYGKDQVGVTNFGYAGEYRDEDTGYTYLRARWYDSSTASFLSEDPIVDVSAEPYGYASGNPLSYSDPLGLITWDSVKRFFSHPTVKTVGRGLIIVAATAGILACTAATAGVCAGAMAPIVIGTIGFTSSVADYAISEECKTSSGWAAAGLMGIIPVPGSSLGRAGVTSVVNSAKSQVWKVGDPLDTLTRAGNKPSWSTIRSRYWKNEALAAESINRNLTPAQVHRNNQPYIDKSWTVPWTDVQIARMKKGKAPQRPYPHKDNVFIETMELSHESVPQRNGGTIDVVQRWPEEHAAVDPYRKLKGGRYDLSAYRF